MREARYDEVTDTWKRPWWANDQDDGGCCMRRTRIGTFSIDWKNFLVGIRNEKILNVPGYNVSNYYQHWLTLYVGPFWLSWEWFRDTEDAW